MPLVSLKRSELVEMQRAIKNTLEDYKQVISSDKVDIPSLIAINETLVRLDRIDVKLNKHLLTYKEKPDGRKNNKGRSVGSKMAGNRKIVQEGPER